MTITVVTGEDVPEAKLPLLGADLLSTSVNFKGRPSVRSRSGCWKSAPFIIGVGVAERFSYYGISGNLVSYLTGKLGQPMATAASMMNAWFGVSSLLPIVGALVADSFAGRFRMIIVACVLYIAGLGALTLSALLTELDAEKCRASAAKMASSAACPPSQLQLVYFFASLYFVALAQGGFTPCVQAFGADQYDDTDERESKGKSSFFNWWYFSVVGFIMVPIIGLTDIQDNFSWILGFGIPAITMCFSLALFLAGIGTYRFRVITDKRNPFMRINRVFIEVVKNWRASPVPVSLEENGPPALQRKRSLLKFLDKALVTADGSLQDEKLCSVHDVEDAKGIIRLIPIWFACMGYSIVYAQPSTLFTKQAATMDRHLFSTSIEIPSAALQQVFVASFIVIMMPIYDRVFVPIARAITKRPSGITMLQRIAIGLVLSLISIIFAAFVEKKRLALARELGLVERPDVMIPMSFWWLAPQYVLAGVADVFAMVGLQEFFYDQVPFDLKSIGIALYASILGVGSLTSCGMVSLIQSATVGNGQEGWFADNLNKAHLDYFYLVLMGISIVGFAILVVYSKYFYVYRTKNRA